MLLRIYCNLDISIAITMPSPLIDNFQRPITYLRLSVSDRCDLRCVYCMREKMQFLPKKDILSLEELGFIAENFIALGVKKIRITGGEPLIRRDIMSLFKHLSRFLASGDLDELTLTSNGTQLSRYADELIDYGVKRINISLDSLNATRFKQISRGGDLQQVMQGIKSAGKVGLRVKINMVALQGINDDEIYDMIQWCGDHGHDLTFIEVMPLGDMDDGDEQSRITQYMPLTKIKDMIAEKYMMVNDDVSLSIAGPARYVRLHETNQKIGFITPLTHNFCASCNRVRMTCTGVLYPCLGQENATDFRPIIKNFNQFDDDAYHLMQQTIKNAINHKPKNHDFAISSNHGVKGMVNRYMSVTGG